LEEYIKWNLLNSATSLLSTPIEMASFDFMAKQERLSKDQEDRALQTVNAAVGEALGKLYVEKKFLLKPKKSREDDSKYYFGLQNRISNLDVGRDKIKSH
jgi:endothelin-converting enzyme/putative endopeptidase